MELVTGGGDSQYDLKEAQMRKKRSIEILKAHKVPYIQHLPTIETADAVRVRTAEEIARRVTRRGRREILRRAGNFLVKN